MSKELSKVELTRLAWLTKLRTEGHRQLRYKLKDGDNVCAIGALYEVIPNAYESNEPNIAQKATGLIFWDMLNVRTMNDLCCYSFAQIADALEQRFKTGKWLTSLKMPGAQTSHYPTCERI
jgi:hypothetical protein